jgi:hypothetical protein
MNNMQQISSAASQVIISVIPIVGIVVGGAVVFSYLLWAHNSRMALIRTNQWAPTPFDIGSFSLFLGLLLGVVGLVMTIFLALLKGLSYSLLGGLIPLSLGIALLVFYIVRRFDARA